MTYVKMFSFRKEGFRFFNEFRELIEKADIVLMSSIIHDVSKKEIWKYYSDAQKKGRHEAQKKSKRNGAREPAREVFHSIEYLNQNEEMREKLRSEVFERHLGTLKNIFERAANSTKSLFRKNGFVWLTSPPFKLESASTAAMEYASWQPAVSYHR